METALEPPFTIPPSTPHHQSQNMAPDSASTSGSSPNQMSKLKSLFKGHSNGHSDVNGASQSTSSTSTNGTSGASSSRPESLSTSSSSVEDLPSYKDLVAEYGDSSNTTWVEDKFSIWRHPPTGAAQGFVVPTGKLAKDTEKEVARGLPSASLTPSSASSKRRSNHLVAWGRPLCSQSDLPTVIDAFIRWCETEGYSPIWCCADAETEKVLAENHGWRAVTCIQEDALDPRKVVPEESKEVRKHIKAAEKAGVKVLQEDGVPPEDIRNKIDALIQEWKDSRTGTQVHVTNVEPWRDPDHRKYFYALDAQDNVVGFLFLARIATGWAIKDSLASTNAPKNLTEWLIAAAIHAVGSPGDTASDDDEEPAERLTFGPTPSETLTAPENATSSGPTLKFLSKAYGGIEKYVLGGKREFRNKFKVEGEPIYVCFPPHGLGRHGIQAILKVLTDE